MSTLSVTIIQPNLHWEDRAANLEMFSHKISALKNTEVVLLPEMFSTGFTMSVNELAEDMDGETIGWMRNTARINKIVLVGSVIIQVKNIFFNRLICMMPTGEFVSYDKRHLFAYAGEDQHFHSGSKRLIASINGWRINLQVCYDLRFPVWARQQGPKDSSAEPGEYDLLVYVANWPAKRAHAWKTLLAARAIENQAYVIGVNRVGIDGNGIVYSGDSQVIDPLGEIVGHIGDVEDSLTIKLEKKNLVEVREKFPFLKDADEFQILA